MANKKTGRPKTTGWISAYKAANRLGISYPAMRQALANGMEFMPFEIFRVSDKRILVNAAAVEKRVREAKASGVSA